MAEITDRTAPPDVPTTNALAGIDTGEDVEYNDSGRTEIHLSGATIANLADPPEMGGRITMLTELEVYDVGVFSQDGGQTLTPYVKVRRIGDMWPQGSPRPAPRKSKKEADAEAKEAAKKAAEGKALYDEPALPYDEPNTDGAGAEGDAEPSGPQFSDGQP